MNKSPLIGIFLLCAMLSACDAQTLFTQEVTCNSGYSATANDTITFVTCDAPSLMLNCSTYGASSENNFVYHCQSTDGKEYAITNEDGIHDKECKSEHGQYAELEGEMFLASQAVGDGCECMDGTTPWNGFCISSADYCRLKLGNHAIAYSNGSCGCQEGYQQDYYSQNGQCVSNLPPMDMGGMGFDMYTGRPVIIGPSPIIMP